MIAVDTHVLCFAHRGETAQHAAAAACVAELGQSGARWGIPSPCVAEFLRVATHPKVLVPPSTPAQAVGYLDGLFDAGNARLLGPGDSWWRYLRSLVLAGRAASNRVFDAQIAAVCLDQGVSVLITEDSDFGRFPLLRTARLDGGEWRKWVT